MWAAANPRYALYPLVVHQPALPVQQAISHATARAGGLRGNLPETTPTCSLLQIDNIAAMALGTAVRAQVPAGKGL